jgi:cytochrome c553
MKVKNLLAAPFFAASLMLLSACGGSDLDGATLVVEKGCVACHGMKGKAIAPMYPNLNGQWEAYLRKQLVAYKDGSRVNAIMALQAQNLTHEEIAVLAAHYGE